MDDPAIGGDEIPRFERNDVARNELRGCNFGKRAVPCHPGHRYLEVRQGINRSFRLDLLLCTHDDIDQYESANEEARPHLAYRDADHGDRYQHDVHRVDNLMHHHLELRRGRLSPKFVRPVFGQPP